MASDADQIVGLYQRHARSRASLRNLGLSERPWLDRFLDLLSARPAVLDLGCGAGKPIGRYFIERGCGVFGVDTSPDMIAMCEAQFPLQDWLVADMRALSLGRMFNGLIAWDSFFHLRSAEQRGMFRVFREHAAPRAALMFTSGPSHGEAIGSFEGEPLYHASLDPAEYRSLLDGHGFDVLAHIAEDPTCGNHTIWLAQLR